MRAESATSAFGSLSAAFSCMLAALAVCVAVFFGAPAQAFAADENAYDVQLLSCYGETQVDTAVAQSKLAFATSDWAIVVGSKGWSDALAAAGLAGALECPILYTYSDSLPSQTKAELDRLGVGKVLILGGEVVVGASVEAALSSDYAVTRLAGYDGYETQCDIFEYGLTNDLWSKDMLFVTSGRSFYDALSVAPVAYAHKAPIFLIDSSLNFSQEQEEALMGAARQGYSSNYLVIGGIKAVSSEAEGFVQFLAARVGGTAENCVRLAGETMYDTNVAVAEWAVEHAGMKWDGAAFASGVLPYDALAGAVLQGENKSLIMLVGSAPSVTVDAVASRAGDIQKCVIFGGEGIIKPSMRKYIDYSLGFGYGLPKGSTKLSNGTYLWCDASGVFQVDNAEYLRWMLRAAPYSSSTDWLLMVDTVENKTVVFYGEKGMWRVHKYYPCSTGAWATPTVKGEFTIGSRGLAFGVGFTCWYWTQFYGDYLFHSVTYNPGSMTSIQEGAMGVNISHGCVRLEIQNAKWIYDNIPSRTKVVIF